MLIYAENTGRVYLDGWHGVGWVGVSPAAAEGIPHGGMGGTRMEIYRDRTHLSRYYLQFASKKY